MRTRSFIATVLGVAMTITGFTASNARALDEEDIAKIIFGAAALAIIGHAIEDANDDRPVVAPPRHHWQGSNHRHHGRVDPRGHGRYGARLPAHCEREFRTRSHGTVLAHGARCLSNANVRVRDFPRHCRVETHGRHGVVVGFRSRCLRRHGYSLVRR